jgi:uncharacterized protein DUF4410
LWDVIKIERGRYPPTNLAAEIPEQNGKEYAMKKPKLMYAVMYLVILANATWAMADKRSLHSYNSVVVQPFETAVEGTFGLPEATRSAVIQAVKEGNFFPAVLTPEQSNAGEGSEQKVPSLKLEGRLLDFAGGNAAKRLMVGFGSGRAHATFLFQLKDAASGEIVWEKKVKQTASFWFNSTTSSAAERAELPEGLAKQLSKELKKQLGK